MRMTLHSDYGLRMLTYLALHPARSCTVSEVAESYRLSHNHLLKVALNLKNGGFVHALRGRSGGLRLARPPDEIVIGAVIRCLEDDFALVECFKTGGGNCMIAPVCRIKGIFGEALAAYMAVLDRNTLQHGLENPPALRALLELGTSVPADPTLEATTFPAPMDA